MKFNYNNSFVKETDIKKYSKKLRNEVGNLIKKGESYTKK